MVSTVFAKHSSDPSEPQKTSILKVVLAYCLTDRPDKTSVQTFYILAYFQDAFIAMKGFTLRYRSCRLESAEHQRILGRSFV